jgi:hypothetical protein
MRGLGIINNSPEEHPWASYHHLAHPQGVHRLDFVKERLDRLGILRQVASFKANGRTHLLASRA